ncbi:MAG: DUF1638 domain-containing protein [Thiolinea sp.]
MPPDAASVPQAESVLIIACGALAREIQQLRLLNGWSHVKLQCLEAELHNRPEKIPGKLRAAIAKYRDQYEHIFIGYADCGTGGEIDRIIEQEGLERLPGAHCYAFFTGLAEFEQLAEEELGSFYLTDFLVRHFERLIIRGLGIDKHPQLAKMYFGHYKRLVYLAQTHDPELMTAAEKAAEYLGLEFKHVYTGYGELESGLNVQSVKWRPAA